LIVGRGIFHDVLGPLGDLLGLVTGALEVGDRLRDRHHQTQVARGGLAARDDVAAIGIDLDFQRVELLLAGDDLIGEIAVEVRQRAHGEFDLGLDQTAHLQQFGVDRVEVCVELGRQVLVSHGVLLAANRMLRGCSSPAIQSGFDQPKRPVM
jgi:hypothetical protein